MRELYPVIESRCSGTLQVDDVHILYYEESGAGDGAPALFLHGGPGAGCQPSHRRYFDPAHYRVVLFDQRGCGKSAPFGEIKHNTTAHLIADIERLRDHLGIERWLVFGGSWGSTLAMAYAQQYPERCTGLVLRGIFLGRRAEVDWFLNGMGRFFPEARHAFLSVLPEGERADPLPALHARLTSDDPAVHLPVAKAWAAYESACIKLLPGPVAEKGPRSLAISRIEAHYFVHDCFLEEDQLLRNIARIRHLPAAIVQGRYDAICPPGTADELARAWPEAEFEIVADAGHAASEPGIIDALVRATDRFRELS